MKKSLLVAFLIAPACSVGHTTQEDIITPVSFDNVEIDDSFWKARIETVNKATVPLALYYSQPEVNRFSDLIAYMSGKSIQLPKQRRFMGHLYKSMESAALSLKYARNPEIELKMDSIISIIAEAQQEDGYLYIDHICGNPNPKIQGDKPYSSVLHSHELFNAGHLYEAAVAYYQATGKDNFLKIAEKSAQHVNRVFFVGDPNYNDGKPVMQAPGHEEIEMALCKLYRVTGNRLYLDMAKKFLDIRGVTFKTEGTGTMSATYAQQHAPVRDQREAVGHAVRATYLYAAMAEVDALTGKHDYDKALHAIWNNLVETRMHITGGLGAVQGVEGFGEEYELPNKSAYNETCAAVGNVFFNFRMFLSYGDAKYLDIMELSAFNNSMAGIGLEGKSFFYENPLECDGIRIFNKGGNGRASWFGCACCPPNILRMILQMPGYMYSYTSDCIYLTLYAGSSVNIPLKDGSVMLYQKSDYPYDSHVRLKLDPSTGGQRFKLYLRIPTWARTNEFVPGHLYSFEDGKVSGFKITLNGKDVKFKKDKGFAVIDRNWEKGDEVTLNLPMKARFVDCDKRVEDNHDRHAVVRGPLVYCAEESDNEAVVPRVQNFYSTCKQEDIKEGVFKEGIMTGVINLNMPTGIVKAEKTEGTMRMIPYYAWNNRMRGNTMLIWLPMSAETAVKSIPGIGYLDAIRSVSASTSAGKNRPEGICDGGVASNSRDMHTPFWAAASYDRQSVTIEFNKVRNLSSLSVYWLDRSEPDNSNINKHIMKVPQEWNIECRVNGIWKLMDLYLTNSYELNLNQFNTVYPAENVLCDAVKINITPYEGYKVAISEVAFEFVD